MPLVESLLRGSQGLGMLHEPRIQGREGFFERSAAVTIYSTPGGAVSMSLRSRMP